MIPTVLLSAALVAPAAAQSAHYNAVNDFGPTNPSGAWSYGAEATLGGTFHRSTVYLPANCDRPDYHGVKLACWGDGRPDAAASAENEIFKNLTDTTVTYGAGSIHQPPDVLGLETPIDTAFTLVRFTAPSTGTFSVTGKFENIFDFAFNDSVYVLKNSDSVNRLFTGITPDARGTPVPFSFTTFLNGGNTLDFIVRSSGGATYGGLPAVAGLAADITLGGSPVTTPEPSSMALLGTGLIGLFPMMRRRRNRA